MIFTAENAETAEITLEFFTTKNTEKHEGYFSTERIKL